MGKSDQLGTEMPPVAGAEEQNLVFAMEYVHAVVASDGISHAEFANVNEKTANEILALAQTALEKCFMYGMVQSKHDDSWPEFENQKLAFEILSNWVMIRGKRYQVLEEEFFAYCLKTHDEILRELYGVDGSTIAKEIQNITDSLRQGMAKSAEIMMSLMEQTGDEADEVGQNMRDYLPKMIDKHPEVAEKAQNAIKDMFFGGSFNLSRQTNLPRDFLEDLSFDPGENSDFFDGSDFSGTPFKTLPARIKPLINIDGDYYCTEPNFVRDSTYRAIQRAIIARRPEYREIWNAKQKELSEQSFPDIMKHHLTGANCLGEVYYPIGKGQWAETDCVILCDDVLISIECKAGVEPLNPPAENIGGHLKSVERLLLSAYRQSKRFIDYIYSGTEVALFSKNVASGYTEIAKVKTENLRHIFPIGLTLESFTPFSASIKELEEVKPIADKHDFFALSIDDLIATKYILSGTGEFLHYLEVRQALAAMKNVMLFDEMDHLGAYVSNNRVDQTAKEMMEKENADLIYLDSFDADVIGPYFQDPDYPDVEPRRQQYPERLLELFAALEKRGAKNWLNGDSFLRNMGSDGREQFRDHFDKALPNLRTREATFFATGGQVPAVFWLERNDGVNRFDEAIHKAQSILLAFDEEEMMLFRIKISQTGGMDAAEVNIVAKPSPLLADFSSIRAEADRLSDKIKPL